MEHYIVHNNAIVLLLYPSTSTTFFIVLTTMKYLGKVVCTYSGQQDKLYIKDFTAIYRMPYTFNWNESDEVAIFMKNYGNVLKKEDIDFWRLDIFLDEQGRYKSHSTRKFLGLYPW